MKDGLVVSYRNSTSNHNSRYYKYFLFQLYLIEILHQTTTGKCIECRQKKLYLIEILHQTTTVTPAAVLGSSLYLIEILHQTTTVLSDISLEDMLYLIEILHQTTTVRFDGSTKNGCILSKFYIKPQPLLSTSKRSLSCILSKFYIKPQQLTPYRQPGEVVSYRNSTSNHNLFGGMNARRQVVSYRNSTSNHNKLPITMIIDGVVSYRNSTSNHNKFVKCHLSRGLYLIEILHQTTTSFESLLITRSCILSKFYIKPQRMRLRVSAPGVVSYRNSTSNHNVGPHID